MSVQEPDVSSTPDMECCEEEFQVERIIDKKIENGDIFYLIKWQGFEGEDTWEPEINLLDCPELIKEYEKRVRAETGQQEMDGVNKHIGERRQDQMMANLGEREDDLFPIITAGFNRGLEPERIIGATDTDGKLCFLMQWKGSDISDIVTREEANIKCPQIVIKFYEEKIMWNTNPRTLAEMLGDDEDNNESDSENNE